MPCSKTEKDILYFPVVLIPAVQTFTKLQCEGWGFTQEAMAYFLKS